MEALELISQGYTETAACDDLRLPLATFRYYINNTDGLQDMYSDAMQRGYDAMAEALLRPDNHHLYGHSDAKMAKVQSDNIKWFLEKRKPKEYGQRVEVNHHITADRAITDALNAARNRTQLINAEDVIDVVPVPVQTDDEIMAELLVGA